MFPSRENRILHTAPFRRFERRPGSVIMRISAIHFDPGGDPEKKPYWLDGCGFLLRECGDLPGPAPGRPMTGAREKRNDRAAICQMRTMVILILSRPYSAIKPRGILQPWKGTSGIRFPCLVGRFPLYISRRCFLVPAPDILFPTDEQSRGSPRHGGSIPYPPGAKANHIERFSMNGKIRLAGLVFAFVFAPVLLGATGYAEKGKGPEIHAKIGVISILTGPGAAYGEAITNGFKLAQEEMNARAGLRIDLVIEDSSGKQEQALAAAQKLINSDQVVAILGPTLSTEMKVVGPEANASGVPIMGTTTSSRSPDTTR